MSFIQIQFLVGLFFIVNDSRKLLDRPVTFKAVMRIIAGIILLVLCFLGFGIVR